MKDGKEFSFSELYVGQKFDTSRKITEQELAKFAELSGDFNPLHFDEEYSKKHGFEGRVAHGVLLTAFMSGIYGYWFPGKLSLLMNSSTEHVRPVYIGDTVFFKCEISEKNETFKFIVLKIDVFNQKSEKVARSNFRVKIRDAV